jgi:outer membrane immunogenic protein
MKRILLAGAAVLSATALLSSAQAADLGRMPYKAPPVPYVAPYYNWTGFYLGVNGGGGWGHGNWDSAGGMSGSGGLVGGTAGYNWQVGTWVLGLEGDIDWSDVKGSTNNIFCGSCKTENTWLGTVRGRVGYAADRWLPYVTGGVAFGDVKATNRFFGTSTSSTQVGWAAGAGIEYAFAGNWSAKVEYLHYDLGSFNCGIACSGLPNDNVSFHADTVRGGINVRF